MRTPLRLLLLIIVQAFAAMPIHAESVFVKYRGEVNLAPFECTAVAASSVVRRVCYDRRERYMIINLSGTYYHYCEIDNGTVRGLLAADSKGRFFNSEIKGRFDCRVNRVPPYG